MVICDRCESRDDVREIYVSLDFGPEPVKKSESQFWNRELCGPCRKHLDRAITAALESVPKQART
jgi:hypothetical protein